MRGGMSKQSCQQSEGWLPFEEYADRYDAWFESEKGKRIFQVEIECIRNLLLSMPHPRLEVGVGTGRFATVLDVDDGVDPSPAVLRYAAERGIRPRVGQAEYLPYEDGKFAVVILIVTICFLNDPNKAFRECGRVLGQDGRVVLGFVPKDSPWGLAYLRKSRQGHPFYSEATFYTTRDVIRMAEKSGFCVERARSCLFERPEAEVNAYRKPREGVMRGAGFVGLLLERKQEG